MGCREQQLGFHSDLARQPWGKGDPNTRGHLPTIQRSCCRPMNPFLAPLMVQWLDSVQHRVSLAPGWAGGCLNVQGTLPTLAKAAPLPALPQEVDVVPSLLPAELWVSGGYGPGYQFPRAPALPLLSPGTQQVIRKRFLCD